MQRKMSIIHITLVLVCVLAISCGQLLFKKAGLELETAGTWFNWRVVVVTGAAIILYGTTTFLWIYVLSKVPLNQAYPFIALSFVIVPVLSWWIFKEHIGISHTVGFFLIVSGIILISRATQS